MSVVQSIWQSPPALLRLQSDDVHIWSANLDCSPDVIQALARSLSDDEQRRAQRFRFQEHQHRFIASRGILRHLLSKYLEVKPEQIQFSYAEHGKPGIAYPTTASSLLFNLSHSQALTLYVFTWNRQVGIDIEYHRPLDDLEQLTQRFFTAQEHLQIQSLPPEQRSQKFFQYWTCKEALLKASGIGLTKLSTVELVISEEKIQILSLAEELNSSLGWTLYQFMPDLNCTAALAIENQNHTLHFWQWRSDAITM